MLCRNYFPYTYIPIQIRTFCCNMQDVFPIIPGDTDYRIFSEDYGDIPGLDIIFLLGGYFYHTSYDTLEQFLYVLYLLYLVRIFYFNFISLYAVYAMVTILL